MAAYLHAMSINRRQLLQSTGVAGLGLLAGCGLTTFQARPPKSHRIGFLSEVAIDSLPIDAFRQGLRDSGYVEGQNITVEYRSAEGQAQRLPDLAMELADLQVQVIAAAGFPAIRAARDVTPALPVVMCIIGFDPVAAGLVASLAHPGGHVTGVTNSVGMQLTSKRLELLQQSVPTVSRVAFIGNMANPAMVANFAEIERAAKMLGLEAIWPELREANDLPYTFNAIARSNSDALYIAGEPFLQAVRPRILENAMTHRLPTICVDRRWVEAGGLIGYAPNQPALYARGATYVARILKGASPAELPIEQPREFDFAINLRTAQALGLTIPQHVLLQATEVIQ